MICASVSFGKGSLAMLLRLLHEGAPCIKLCFSRDTGTVLRAVQPCKRVHQHNGRKVKK